MRKSKFLPERGFGWGWTNKGMMTMTITNLRRALNAPAVQPAHRRAYKIGVAILGQYAHDNACDVEGFPIYVGQIGKIRTLCEKLGEKHD